MIPAGFDNTSLEEPGPHILRHVALNSGERVSLHGTAKRRRMNQPQNDMFMPDRAIPDVKGNQDFDNRLERVWVGR